MGRKVKILASGRENESTTLIADAMHYQDKYDVEVSAINCSPACKPPANPNLVIEDNFTRSYVTPYLGEKNGVKEQLMIAEKERPLLWFVNNETGLMKLAGVNNKLKEMGITLVTAPKASLKQCVDKVNLNELLTEMQIPIPEIIPVKCTYHGNVKSLNVLDAIVMVENYEVFETYETVENVKRLQIEPKLEFSNDIYRAKYSIHGSPKRELPYDVVVKPRFIPSNDVVIVKKEEGFEELVKKCVCMKSPVLQQYIEGDEYMVDTVSDLGGNVLTTVPQRKTIVDCGKAEEVEIIKDRALAYLGEFLSENLKIKGAANIDVIKPENGKFNVLDINPRIGRSGYALYYAGLNVPMIILKTALGAEVSPDMLQYELGKYSFKRDTSFFNK